jgi:hypothetical protein
MKHVKSYRLFEKTLKREIMHIEKDEFAILTAWRSKLDGSTNIDNLHKMKKELRDDRFGFVGMTGVGQELGGNSSEPSLMVINNGSPEFRNTMLALARKHDQDYIIYGNEGLSHLVNVADGKNEKDFTKVLSGKAEFYSALSGAKSGENLAFHLAEDL